MNVTCFKCGVSPSLVGSFREVHRTFRSKNVFYCPACFAKRRRRTTAISLLVIVASVSILAAVWSKGHFTGSILDHEYWPLVGWTYLTVIVNAALLSLFFAILVVPHELAHASCARLAGWRVFKISLGLGRTLRCFRIGELSIEINVSPGGGLTWIAPKETAFTRLKYFLIVLAGPCFHLGVLAVTWPDQPWSEFLRPWMNRPAPLVVFFFANLLMLVFALLPYTTLVTCGQIPVEFVSDGLAMLKTPFLPASTVRQMHGYYFALEGAEMWQVRNYQAAKQWYEKGLQLYPDDISNRMGLGLALSFLNDLRGGRAQWRAVLDRSDLSGEVRALMLNNVAWTDLMIGDADLLEEADRFSQEAVAQEPWRPPYLGTRGSVLIERGDVNEGLPLVRHAFNANDDPRLKALNACYIALGEYHVGNQVECRAQLELARRIDPDCMLLEKMESRLSAASKPTGAESHCPPHPSAENHAPGSDT